jgi:hypothetical protein
VAKLLLRLTQRPSQLRQLGATEDEKDDDEDDA